MPRYRRYFSPEDWVFITMVTAERRPWLQDAQAKQDLLWVFRSVKRHHGYRHIAHVILDDHLHWMLIAEGRAGVSRLVSSVKLGVLHRRRRIGQPWRDLWQPRFYDHILRNEVDFRRHLDYIHYNPVKHGYVASPAEYPWSSFPSWVRRGVYDYHWGEHEPASTTTINYES